MYYKVTANRGHCGAGKGSLLTFAIEADSMTDALKIARSMPMVKHSHPNAISGAIEISKEEFDKLRQESAYYRRNNK